MISLMVIFVLLLVVHLNNKSAEAENARKEAENAREILLDELTQEFEEFAAVHGEKVRVERDIKDPLGTRIMVPEKFFNFETNEDTIPPGGIVFLQDFAPRLARTACGERFRDHIGSIVVEGHADSDGGDVYNLELSQKRAMSVVREILKILRDNNESFEECFLGFLSANGRGNREPLSDDDGNEDKDRSRRVEFKVRARSADEIQRFKENLEK